MENKHYVNLLSIFFVACIVFFMFASFVFLLFEVSDDLQNIGYGYVLENHIKKNNLSLPFPTSKYKLGYNELRNDELDYDEIFNKEIDEFKYTLFKHYEYVENTYDCKYWAYVWTLYWKYSLKDTMKLKYVTTDNHIFVMVYNELGYCTLDSLEVNCLWV